MSERDDLQRKLLDILNPLPPHGEGIPMEDVERIRDLVRKRWPSRAPAPEET